MEQSLADLAIRGVVTKDAALAASSRPDQLLGLMERGGFVDDTLAPFGGGLRLAES
jgi:hypothetical protein